MFWPEQQKKKAVLVVLDIDVVQFLLIQQKSTFHDDLVRCDRKGSQKLI